LRRRKRCLRVDGLCFLSLRREGLPPTLAGRHSERVEVPRTHLRAGLALPALDY